MSAPAHAERAVPDHVPPHLVVDFDHFLDASIVTSGLDAYRALGRRYRIFFSTFSGGFWVLTRPEDIEVALRRTELWSSRFSSIPKREGTKLPITLDPPEHMKYRRLINPAFSPQRVEALAPKMRAVAESLLASSAAALADEGRISFLDRFARPFPAALSTHILGLPPERWHQFMDWNHRMVHAGTLEDRRRAEDEARAYLRQAITERAVRPDDGLLSQLLASEVDGAPLGEEGTLGFAMQQFGAAFDTVTATLGHIFHFLATHPRHRQALAEDQGIVPDATEELLRVFSVACPARTAASDFRFAGVEIREGDRLLVPLVVAGQDQGTFLDALRVDFRRTPKSILTFGAGPHRCAGSHLARQEIATALEVWHRVIPDYGLDEEHTASYCGGGVVTIDDLWLTGASDQVRLRP
jgi:cytochrome P450